MLKTVHGIIHDGKVSLLEPLDAPEGAPALVTLLAEEEGEPSDLAPFWLAASQPSLDAVWDNVEDDVYAQLLQE